MLLYITFLIKSHYYIIKALIFQRKKYQLTSEKFLLLEHDPEYVTSIYAKTFKYNRTAPAFNLSAEFAKDLDTIYVRKDNIYESQQKSKTYLLNKATVAWEEL